MKIKFIKKIDYYDEKAGDLGKIKPMIKKGDIVDLPNDQAINYLIWGLATLTRLKDMIEIPKGKTGDLALIGRAEGVSIGHCIFTAHRHEPNFDEEVIGFCVEKVVLDAQPPFPNLEISFWKSKYLDQNKLNIDQFSN